MTPEEAWKHVKALWPDVDNIRLHNHGNTLATDLNGLPWYVAELKLDWPEGVTQWPPPEPQYREPHMPEDWGARCELSNDGEKWYWFKIAGLLSDKIDHRWLTELGSRWRYARIRVDDEWMLMDTAPKNREILLKMGGKETQGVWCFTNRHWISLGLGKGLTWDRDNQPTGWKEIE